MKEKYKLMNILERIRTKYYRVRDKYYGKKCYRFVKKSPMQYGIYTGTDREEVYIVSMASYAGRYEVLPLALKSLLLQNTKPDRIIVWLDEEKKENALTSELKELCKYGVEFRFTDDNIKPHKKYLYAMMEFPEACIITVDDDLIYSADLLESLIIYHKQFPECVCARRVHKITFDENGNVKPYQRWEYEYRKAKNPSFNLCATGGAGVLYPPNILPLDALKINKIRELSLEADDIWLKVMELCNKIKVVWVKNKYVMPLEIENSQCTSLNSTNVGKGKNDIFLEKLFYEYPEALKTLKDNF